MVKLEAITKLFVELVEKADEKSAIYGMKLENDLNRLKKCLFPVLSAVEIVLLEVLIVQRSESPLLYDAVLAKSPDLFQYQPAKMLDIWLLFLHSASDEKKLALFITEKLELTFFQSNIQHRFHVSVCADLEAICEIP